MNGEGIRETVHNKVFLSELQSLDLNRKIALTSARIIEWYREYNGQVYISFSGGKDSTVLLDIARKLFPDIEAVFIDTGLEFPEIRQFVKSFENVTILRPKMRFDEVIKKYGYPVIGKEVSNSIYDAKKNIKIGNETIRVQQLRGTLLNKDGKPSMYNKEKWRPLLNVDFLISDNCCRVMKKSPAHEYNKKSGKKAIIAMLAVESRLREAAWLKTGCNAFNLKYPQSQPMAFWKEQDVLEYIKTFNINIAPVYGEVVYKEDPEQLRLEDFGVNSGSCDRLCTTGCDRTGCIFCGFGAHLEKEGNRRFERLKITHPKQYKYCIGGGEYDENGIWQPNKKGLGMGHVFDELNKIYGEDFIKY